MQMAVGKTIFPSKKAALEAVRKVLNKTPIGSLLDGSDFELVRAYLDLHPRREIKLAGGCRGIMVKLNHVPLVYSNQRGFHIVKDDGSTLGIQGDP